MNDSEQQKLVQQEYEKRISFCLGYNRKMYKYNNIRKRDNCRPYFC